MKKPWFKQIGWFLLPVSVPGAIIALAALHFVRRCFWRWTATPIP